MSDANCTDMLSIYTNMTINMNIYIYTQGVSSHRRVFKQLLGEISKFQLFPYFLIKFWSEFCKRCFWVFRPMGGFLYHPLRNLYFSYCLASVFLLFRAVTVRIMFFPYHHSDFVNFASQPIIMETCKQISCRMGVCCFLWYE